MNHKYSTWTLLTMLLLLSFAAVIALLESEDIDELCVNGLGDHIYKENGTWVCKDTTGWIEYSDLTYTDSNRLTIGTTLQNFSMTNISLRQADKPTDVVWNDWFNGTHVLSDAAGSSYVYKWRYKAEPQAVNAYCEAFWNIGGAVGQLPLRLITFPKGNGVEQIGTFTNIEYTLDTWYQNGALIQIQCSDNVEFWDIELTIERLHIGRGVY